MKIYITKFSSFTPSPENPSETPKLPYVDALFKRRLSQITRMTIEAVHGLVEDDEKNANLKLVFASFRGEIARQLKINRGLIEDAEIMPAQFSISVFNTPPAATTIALKMKAGYTAIYPSEDNFSSCILAAASGILAPVEHREGETSHKIIFAYADEKIPDEYKDVAGYTDELPLAFACIFSTENSDGAIEVDLSEENLSGIAKVPKDFLDFLLKKQRG